MAYRFDCPLIEVSGAPHERGVQYGRQARERIHRGVALYTARVTGHDLDWPMIRSMVREFLPVIAAFDDSYIDEMKGVAHGAELEFEQVLLLNARTEILKLASRPDLRAKLQDALAPDACTGVIVMPEAAQEGRLLHAQNWDWRAECAETSVVLRIRREDGPDILTFTEAGGLARSGLNAVGIAITANYLESDRDYRQLGVPLAFIRRKALQQEHLALAMRAVYATPKSASNNIMVSHRDGIAINFECAPDETFQVHAADGLIVHANHWQSPIALAKLKDMGIQSTPDSLYRDIRVRWLLAQKRSGIGLDTVKEALFDDFESPWAVCRPPRQTVSRTDDLSATVAMIAMDPSAGIMDVAILPALNRKFTRFSLEQQGSRVAAVAE